MRIIRGRKALVTGAAAGIGRALALALAREGADLFLIDIDADRLEAVAREARELGVTAVADRCDLSDAAQVSAAVERLTAAWGGLDILINNAGVSWYGPTEAMTPAQWQRILAVNLLAPVQLFAELLPLLAAADEAHVLNVCSMFGVAPWRKAAAYQTSKYGLVGFTAALRAEFEREHFGVTALCPGFVDTALLDGKANDRAAPAWISTTPEKVARKAIDGDPPQARPGAGDAGRARLLADRALRAAPHRLAVARGLAAARALVRLSYCGGRAITSGGRMAGMRLQMFSSFSSKRQDWPLAASITNWPRSSRHATGAKRVIERVAAGLEREHEAVGVVGGVAERHLADRPAGAAGKLPLAEQVVGDALLVDRRERLQEIVRVARRGLVHAGSRPRSARAARCPWLSTSRSESSRPSVQAAVGRRSGNAVAQARRERQRRGPGGAGSSLKVSWQRAVAVRIGELPDADQRARRIVRLGQRLRLREARRTSRAAEAASTKPGRACVISTCR